MVSLLMLGGAFGLFEWAVLDGRPLEEARTLAANVFVAIETAYLFNCRSLDRSLWAMNWRTNSWLWAGSSTMIVLQLGLTYHPWANKVFQTAPLTLLDWGMIVAVALFSLAAVEVEKRVRMPAHG